MIRALRPLGIAVAWIALYVLVGSGISLGLAAGFGIMAAYLRFAIPDATSPFVLVAFAPFFVIGFGIATWLVGARLARHSWSDLGWRPERGVAPSLARGFAVGAAAAAVAVALTIVLGGAQIRFALHWSAYVRAAIPLAFGLLAAALIEELVFRGFPVRRLADALGAWPAILILSVAFALAHLANDNVSPFGILNVGLAGVWLSIAFFSPGGMALGWGLHFGWNLGLALLGAPVSGMRFGPPQAVYHPGPHPWLDGGAFGPEGGLVGTIAMATGVVAILGSRVRRPTLWVAT